MDEIQIKAAVARAIFVVSKRYTILQEFAPEDIFFKLNGCGIYHIIEILEKLNVHPFTP